MSRRYGCPCEAFGVPRYPSPSAYDYLYSLSSVLLALRADRRLVKELFIRPDHDEATHRDRAVYTEILSLATDRQIAISRVSKERLNRLAGNRPHQGVVLKASCLSTIALDRHLLPFDPSA